MVLDLALIQSNFIGQFVLPFALIFAITYGSLRTAGVFSNSKNVDLIIAAVIGFIAALTSSINAALIEFMPALVGLLVILFIYNLIYKLIEGGQKKPMQNTDVLLVVGALLIILAIKGREFIPDLAGIDQNNLIFIFALLGIFVVWKKGSGAKLEGQPPSG
ncbi:Uncharacterised protein [uncultured archaeon]|nr:Uncharacterised protein [uncultured archaeon]